MGGICSRRSTVDNAPSGTFSQPNGITDHGVPSKTNNNLTPPQLGAVMDKQVRESFSFPEMNNVNNMNNNALTSNQNDVNDGIPRLSRSLSHKSRSTKSRHAAVAKVSEVSSLFGRAGTAGFGKAVEVLDTLGSSGLFLGATTKGIKISILSFEVANTVVMGANLMLSLSKENIKHMKEVVLPSEGVQYLVSKNMDELLRIAAADKREELKIFSREVVRFGNRCKDHQWHNLDRYFDDMDRHFEKLGSGFFIKKQLKEEVETMMHQLITMVQYTAELYHELHALDRFEQDYQRKLQEEDNSNTAQRGDSLAILRAELKSQRKYVRNLKKKSLWSMVLEEAMKRLVDIVQFLHLQFHAVFGKADSNKPKVSLNHQKLGPAGLALHYANIITQIVEIDTLVSQSSSIPPNTRDALYQGLPPTVKSVLRSKLQLFQLKEELTVPQIKAEMEKTLQWLVPIATNTTKAHHGFGWVGEWANTGSEVNRKQTGQTDLLRIETLHHADKEKTEACILDLVVWLHHLVSQSRSGPNGGIRSPIKSPIRSPNQNVPLPSHKPNGSSPILTVEDQEMLRAVNKRKLTPGISKSQEFDTLKDRSGRLNRLSKSNSHSPTTNKEFFPLRRPPTLPVIDFDIDKLKALDVIDRVDNIRSL